MPSTDEIAGSMLRDWAARLKRARLVLTVSAAVLAGLWLADLLGVLPALAAFAAIVALLAVEAATREPGRAVVAPGPAVVASAAEPVFDAVLAGLPDAVIALDHDGDVVAFNARAAAMAPALRRNQPISLGVRAPEVLDAIRRARASGATQRVEFYERVPVERWYETVITPIAAAERLQTVLLATFHDLTPLRRVEEMRADFVANASHELRTPLAALSGFIETLQGPARNDPQARERFLGIMHAQATRMARLIDDLLSLSRIELNAHVRPQTRVDLVAILRQVADGLQTLARDRGVEINLMKQSDPLVVLGDRDELLRLFENLLENALKYGAAGKRVEVTVLSCEGASGTREARIAVRDWGPGIAPEHLPRLTERFYRVDVGESRAQGGTGLGLALVKHILNRHGGRLTIDSVFGEGATFTVHLPLAHDGVRRDAEKVTPN